MVYNSLHVIKKEKKVKKKWKARCSNEILCHYNILKKSILALILTSGCNLGFSIVQLTHHSISLLLIVTSHLCNSFFYLSSHTTTHFYHMQPLELISNFSFSFLLYAIPPFLLNFYSFVFLLPLYPTSTLFYSYSWYFLPCFFFLKICFCV